MLRTGQGARVDRDLIATAVGAAVFSLALSAATLALPLRALDAGYSNAAVGFLTGVSAVSQLGIRLLLGRVMRRYPDSALVAVSGALLALSCLLVAASAALVPFVVAELLQGVARGCFWTGSQTHVVRSRGSAVSRLATVNFSSSIGLLIGPALAGLLADRSVLLALLAAAVVAAAGLVPALLLDRLPPFQAARGAGGGRVWRQPGVRAGCWAGVTAGAWRALLASYVPVALQQAGQPAGRIGVLVSVANGASIAGAVVIARVNRHGPRAPYVLATAAVGIGTACSAAVAGSFWLVAGVLAVCGLGEGILLTLGPALATDAVHPEDVGDAIAATGTFRAAALFASPVGVGALLAALPLTGAMALVGGAITLPVLAAGRISGRAP